MTQPYAEKWTSDCGTVTLYQGGCLQILPTLEAGSVDAVVADLPYGTTACKWDAVIPFAPLWKCYRHVAKDDAAFVLTASQPFTSSLVMSNPEAFRYEWIWEKPKATGHLDARRKPLKAHENVCVFYSQRCTFNPRMTEGTPYTNRHKPGDTGNCYGEVKAYSFENKGTRFPRSVQKFSHVAKPEHDTQKPVELIAYMVETYSNEGDTILDNTMGSGTTGVACVNTGRKFIGIELDPGYYEIAKRRIQAALADKASKLIPA